ncbi:MAG: DUF4179 domain-containing protein [Clostridiales bacterium]|nr:DUF4179 domain-containing protein [Clostridiales bacterium]
MKARNTIRFSLALALIVICLTGIALAVSYPRISEVFGSRYGDDFQAWMEDGNVASPENSITVEGVTFTLNEVAVRNRGLYGLGSITPGEGILLLASEYTAAEPYGYAVFQGDKAPEGTPSLMEVAAAEGKTIKQVEFWLEKIGTEDGALLEPDGWGSDERPMRDGSVQFLFEAEDGIAVQPDAEKYTVQLLVAVRNVSADGEVDYDHPVRREWTVEIAPQPFAEALETSKPEKTEAELPVVSRDAIQPKHVNAPQAYEQTGTLPIYQAIPRSFQGKLDYAWFNQSGIVKEEENARRIGGMVDYADGGHLEWYEQSIYYTVHDGTYEAVSEVFEGGTVRTVTETLPKGSMAVQAASIASWMTFGFPGTDQIYTLEKTELTHITLEEAKEKAESLLDKLGLEGYTCTAALDMGQHRIREMGNELNHQMDIGNLGGNAFRYDYSNVSVRDEGYYLKYHKLGADGDLAGLFQATFYITAEGVQMINLNDQYAQGGIVDTPEKLLDADTVCEKLPEEMAKSRHPETLVEIQRASLTWMPMRADQGSDMIFSPVWMITYVSDEGEAEGYTGWAAFDAVTGKLVDAIFN